MDHHRKRSNETTHLSLRSPLACPLPQNPSHHNKQLYPVLSALCVAADVLELSVETRFAAACLLHRFSILHTSEILDNEDWKWILVSCIFIACKNQEEPRRLRDMINCAKMMDWSLGEGHGIAVVTVNATPPNLDQDYWSAKQQLVYAEQYVLRCLAFDVTVTSPFRALLLLSERNDTVLSSVHLLNDSIFHVQALRHDVLPLAAAAVKLTSNELGKGAWMNNIPTDDLQAAYVDLDNAIKFCKEMNSA